MLKNNKIVVQNDTPKPVLPTVTAHMPTTEARVHLDLTNTQLEMCYESVDLLDDKGFALVRRNGFGGSDSSILLGVNPYTTLPELISQKASTTVSEEELAIGQNVAVMKGNELEPLILHKFATLFDTDDIKPTDMYRFKQYPWLTMNFDGIIGKPQQYYPVEAKVVTKRGERHYAPQRAWYDSMYGFRPMPENYALAENSIETKAAQYGIPAYYYTQLQQEMLATNAPFGFLATLWEEIWGFRVWYVYADPVVQHAIIINGAKAWDKVEILKGLKNGNQMPSM